MEQTALKTQQIGPNLQLTKDKKQFSGIAARALKFLSQGVTAEEVSKALGCDPSLISQFKSDPEFQEQLHELVTQSFKDANEIDANYQEIEKKLSGRLKDQTDLMHNPDQILRVLKFANEAKRKLAPNHQNGHQGNSNGEVGRTAILILPMVVRKEFELNPLNEIVGVDGTELVTLNSKSLDTLVAQKKVLKLPNTNGTTKRESSDPYSDL